MKRLVVFLIVINCFLVFGTVLGVKTTLTKWNSILDNSTTTEFSLPIASPSVENEKTDSTEEASSGSPEVFPRKTSFLYSLDPISQGSYVHFRRDYTKSVTETSYISSLVNTGSAWNSDDDDFIITYYLNGKYDKLSGTVFRPYDSLEINDYYPNGFVEIYGDDSLLYHTVADEDTYTDTEFEIDISGYRFLSIKIYGNGYLNGWSNSVSSPTIALGDLEIRENA